MGRHSVAFQQAERTVRERLGLGETATAPAHHGERAEGGNEFGMLRAERALLGAEGSAQPLLGPRQVAVARVDASERAERHADLIVLAAQLTLEDRECTQQQCRGLLEVAGHLE